MPSPFPGMDPYLEGYLWPDFHNALANKIRQQLTPLLRPNYAARLEIYVVEDRFPDPEMGMLYPDAEVMRLKAKSFVPSAQSAVSKITPAPLSLPVLLPTTLRLAKVAIRNTSDNTLVSCIEILSPVNKREPGLTTYCLKRQRLYQAGVHLLELDLIRRGTRPFAHPQLPDVDYAIALTRAHAGVMDVWPLQLSEHLPILPVPLKSPDLDVSLDLPGAIATLYDEAGYDLSIDYTKAPPPPILSTQEQEWMGDLMSLPQ